MNTNTMDLLDSLMSDQEARTVKQIATALKLSESRVRELIKAGDYNKSNTKPATFSATPVSTPTPTPTTTPEQEATPKAKRTNLNPQYKINAKVKAVQEAGGKLYYNRHRHVWILETDDGRIIDFTPKQFAKETPTSLV